MEAKPIHIVIADDDDDDQFIIREALSDIPGCCVSVMQVYDGLQLLDYLNRRGSVASNYEPPDVVLLDINMPLMNGIEALSAIRSNNALNHLPVYLISTSRREDQFEGTNLDGAQGFYTKPNRIGAYKRIFEEILLKIRTAV